MELSNGNLNEIKAESHVCEICDTMCNSENNLRYHITKFHAEPDVSFNFNPILFRSSISIQYLVSSFYRARKFIYWNRKIFCNFLY